MVRVPLAHREREAGGMSGAGPSAPCASISAAPRSDRWPWRRGGAKPTVAPARGRRLPTAPGGWITPTRPRPTGSLAATPLRLITTHRPRDRRGRQSRSARLGCVSPWAIVSRRMGGDLHSRIGW